MEALLWRRAVAGPVRPRGTPMTSRHGDPVGARLRQFYAAFIDERRLGARRSFFAHAVGKAEQLLFALRRRADDDQDALLGVFKTGLQVNAVGPHVDVALGRQIALLPMLVLVGSGLVIVPFLEKGLVQQTGWLDERQFLVAVAVGMISPGPVVITATFVGYLVAGFWGSVVATIGIFLPSFLLILIVAPILMRYRANPNVQGFVRGAYAAAIGTILGACVLLARIAIGDWLTALVALGSLVVLFRFRVSNPVLVAVTAVIGLIAYPLIRPEWLFVR